MISITYQSSLFKVPLHARVLEVAGQIRVIQAVVAGQRPAENNNNRNISGLAYYLRVVDREWALCMRHQISLPCTTMSYR